MKKEFLYLSLWLIGALSWIAGGAYLFGYLTVGPLELASALVRFLLGSESALDECSAASGLASGVCLITWLGGRFLGAVLWVLLLSLPMPFIRRSIKIIELGSEEAYAEYCREQNTPEPLGELVGISNSKGGFLSTSEATIETTRGFYRVAGLVGGFERGAPVYRLHKRLLIGDGYTRKEFLVLE